MSKLQFLPLVLLASSCWQDGQEEPAPSEVQPPLVVAAQSVSLEFPLDFDAGDAPPGYTKIDPAEGRNDTPGDLITALVACSPYLAWIEKTSHSISVIMPSSENAVWRENEGWHPSDEDIITCIKQSTDEPFLYCKLPRGTETYQQN